MITLLVAIVVLGVIFWWLSEVISAIAGAFFIVVAAIFTLKMAKEIFK